MFMQSHSYFRVRVSHKINTRKVEFTNLVIQARSSNRSAGHSKNASLVIKSSRQPLHMSFSCFLVDNPNYTPCYTLQISVCSIASFLQTKRGIMK